MNLLPLVPSPTIGTTNEVAARSHVTQEYARDRARAMFVRVYSFHSREIAISSTRTLWS